MWNAVIPRPAHKLEHDIDTDNTFSLMAYGGTRDNLQYQSIGSNAAGTGVTSKTIASTSKTSGGVAQINRDFDGMDIRYTHKGVLMDGPYNLSLGANYDTMTDHRTGYDNFIALPGASLICGVGVICGVKGTLRRDENDTAWNFDQYAQAEWSRWSLTAGIRHSDVHIGGTERTGAELSIDSDLGNGFAAYASYAYLDAIYSDSFCSGSISATCAGGTLVNSGKVIPGTYRQTAYAEISWKYAPIGFSTAIETRANSKVYVSDTTTDAAPGYTIVNWRGGFAQNLHQWHFAEFLRVENLLDRNYIGSVKINDSNSQFYEPGANRNWLLGLNTSYQF